MNVSTPPHCPYCGHGWNMHVGKCQYLGGVAERVCGCSAPPPKLDQKALIFSHE
jgi:hypothetical protein